MMSDTGGHQKRRGSKLGRVAIQVAGRRRLKRSDDETIRVPLGGRQVEKTKARAIVDELMRLAIGGDLRAATIITGLAERIDRDTDQSNDETPNDRALLDSFIDREIRRRATDPKTNEDSPKKDQLP